MDAPQPQPQSQSPQPQAAKREFAWQPLTFSGVSKFAGARFGRLWLVQFLFSLIIAAAVIWFLCVDWFPVVVKAAKKLPESSGIRDGKMDWRGEPAVLLAENRFLAIAVDLRHAGGVRSPAHVSVELGLNDYKVFSLFGYVQWPYPRHWIISLSRDEEIAWWGAWSPVILAAVAAGTVGLLLFLCSVLSTIYFLPVWLMAFFTNRELNLRGSWCLCGAAQMSAALWLALAVCAYGLGWFGLIGLALAFAAHLVIGWVIIAGSILKLPLVREVTETAHNPFAAKKPDLSQNPDPPHQTPSQAATTETGQGDPKLENNPQEGDKDSEV